MLPFSVFGHNETFQSENVLEMQRSASDLSFSFVLMTFGMTFSSMHATLLCAVLYLISGATDGEQL